MATQIDSYRALGVGLKPDWVIFDPEGYPDNHSGLDAPGGASNATLALYATYWTAMLQGWQQGIDSVDPSLNAARLRRTVRVPQLPALHPLACPSSWRSPSAAAVRCRSPARRGSNVRGFISFDAACTPAATLASEAATLREPALGRPVQHAAVQRRRVLPAALDLVLGP